MREIAEKFSKGYIYPVYGVNGDPQQMCKQSMPLHLRLSKYIILYALIYFLF
jgi:hypothetical protein